MNDCIERKKAIELIQPHVKPTTVYGEGYLQAIEHATDILELMPAADVQPVKRGRWIGIHEYCKKNGCIPSGIGIYFWCSECEKAEPKISDYCPNCGARMDGDAEVKTINRAVVRGKPLDEDCKTANVSTHEFGPNDNRCFCYGLYVPCNDWEIQQKCLECKAYVDNAKPPKDGEING